MAQVEFFVDGLAEWTLILGGESTDGALPPGFGRAIQETDGCACDSGGSPTGLTATLLLLWFSSTRRRRQAS